MKNSSDRLNKRTSNMFIWSLTIPLVLYSIWTVYCFDGGIKEYCLVPIVTFTVFYQILLLRDYIDILEKRIFELENKIKDTSPDR